MEATATSDRTGRTSISAHAAVQVDPTPDGGIRVSELRSQVPLVLRRTGTTDSSCGSDALPHGYLPTATVHLVNAAAGPLAGDRLRLDISVGAGVALVLRTVAATVALPGRGDHCGSSDENESGHGNRADPPSLFDVRADVGPDAALAYLPEPTVAARGCRHHMRARIRLASTARLLWREEIVLGRFGEPAGSISCALHVDVDVEGQGQGQGRNGHNREGHNREGHNREGRSGMLRPLLRQELCLDPGMPGLDGPAVLGGARVTGSLLIAGPGPDGLGTAPAVTDTFALLPLAGPGVLISALAPDAVALRQALNTGRTMVARW
ncbi:MULTISPECIES: urease accessory protein UreD [unclassified Frankia]|uniref:urease accessory protein UreD n=1 Tax=unclassified Frankia TaxID=2632575 RepID=UPI002AD56290|nr:MULTISPECIES: urease accessory protein UreD [unclassified Frankia]